MIFIDGHNLIPHIHGLSLTQIDDEAELIQQLQVYCRVKRRAVEVYFDRAAPGHRGERKFGMVTAHFVQEGLPADDAIIARLRKLGKAARNVSVVTSDRRIRAAVAEAHATSITSDDFARELNDALYSAPPVPGNPTPTMSDQQLNEWLDLFKNGKKDR